jgi:hypothetical protein
MEPCAPLRQYVHVSPGMQAEVSERIELIRDYSIGRRYFLRLRLRASADFSRRFSPGGT